MKKNIKVGIIQMSSTLGNIEANLVKALEEIKKVSDKGAEIICLPELFLTGYDMNNKPLYSKKTTLENFEVIKRRISKIAKKEKVEIIVPIGTCKKNKVYNSALIINSHGEVIGNYNKTHLYDKERHIFEKGNEIKIWNTDLCKVGVMICYDAGFPEVARILTLKGAKIIFCPSAWKIEDQYIWRLNMTQRAIENRVFIVGVNSTSKTKELHLFGGSIVTSPDGQIIEEFPINEELSKVCTINLKEVEKYKGTEDYLLDRRPELYKSIAKKD